MKERMLVAVVCVLSLAMPGSAPAQQTAPSKRVMVLCDAFGAQESDLIKMVAAIANRDETDGVVQMAAVAELNRERCVSVHSLLFAYELLGPGSDKAKVGEYVGFRMGQYAALKSDLEYANRMVALTKLPGVAREAQSRRDRICTFDELCATLRPK